VRRCRPAAKYSRRYPAAKEKRYGMARSTIAQRLAAAEVKTAQLRLAFTKAARKLDARRKIIIGGTVMAAMNDDPALRERVCALLRERVTRPLDREVVAEWLSTT
jgi:hypothetical protein